MRRLPLVWAGVAIAGVVPFGALRILDVASTKDAAGFGICGAIVATSCYLAGSTIRAQTAARRLRVVGVALIGLEAALLASFGLAYRDSALLAATSVPLALGCLAWMSALGGILLMVLAPLLGFGLLYGTTNDSEAELIEASSPFRYSHSWRD